MSVVFQVGDRGPAVAEIRARLARLGLLPGSSHNDSDHETRLRYATGSETEDPSVWMTTALMSAEYDQEVADAIKVFQAERGITADGLVGPETFRRLEEARWRLGDRVLSYSVGHPPVGEDVLDLQQRLNGMGFACGREDGMLGASTDHGIREFQRNTGLTVDGVCGPATFRAISRLRRTVGKKSAHSVQERYNLPNIRTGVRGKLVVLDLGHWNSQPSNALDPVEMSILTQMTSHIEGRLVALGTQVVSRTADPSDAAQDRAAWANSIGADLVLSFVLCRKGSPEDGQGIAAYFYGTQAGNHSLAGELAAQLILEKVTEQTSLANRAAHPRTWEVLRLTRMPTVRVECGSLHHDGDLLRDDLFIDRLAQAIAEAIERFFEPEHVIG